MKSAVWVYPKTRFMRFMRFMVIGIIGIAILPVPSRPEN